MENTETARIDPSTAAALDGLATSMRGRRILLAVLVVGTVLAMCGLMVATLSRGGFGLLDSVLTVFFLITLPWTAIGFWNAVIGLVVLRLSPDPAGLV